MPMAQESGKKSTYILDDIEDENIKSTNSFCVFFLKGVECRFLLPQTSVVFIKHLSRPDGSGVISCL